VALTGPYFHNGSVDKLADAVRVMATAQLAATVGNGNPPSRRIEWSAAERAFIRSERRALSDSEVEDIVAFLGALSSDSLVAAMNKATP
jgi:cytochrome c peroxidase